MAMVLWNAPTQDVKKAASAGHPNRRPSWNSLSRSRKLALLATIPEDKSLRSIPLGKVGALHLRVCGHTLVVAEPSAYDLLIGSFLVSLCLLEGVKLLLAT